MTRGSRYSWLVAATVLLVLAGAIVALRGETGTASNASATSSSTSTTTAGPAPWWPPDPATTDGARAAAQRYADAWAAGDAATWWAGLTAAAQAAYTVGDIEDLVDQHPDRPRLVVGDVVLLDSSAANVAFLSGGKQILIYDGEFWRWQPSG